MTRAFILRVGDRWREHKRWGDEEGHPDLRGPRPAIIGDKWGYVDETGKVVIEPRFDDAWPFSDGLASVRMGDADAGKWGYIDATGKFVIEPQFAGASFFSGGLAAVTVDDFFKGDQGYIDRTGRMVIAPQFEEAGLFTQGYALAVKTGSQKPWHLPWIDASGARPRFEKMDEGRGEGMMTFRCEGKWGYLRTREDTAYLVAVRPQFEAAQRFSEGLAAVKQGGVWGYIDKKGKMVIAAQFDAAMAFSGGEAKVTINGRSVIINKDGKVVRDVTD